MDILEASDDAVRALADYPFESRYAAVPREPGTSETLRVHYIDEGPRDGRPVVFLHGGSLIMGDSTVYQHLENLAVDGDLVLVTIQYRLNAHGFLAIPSLPDQNFGFAFGHGSGLYSGVQAS